MAKRKSHYTVRMGNRLCEHIALGDTLKKALEKEGVWAPTMATFWKWLDEYPEFKEKYARARQMQADVHADRVLEIAEEVLKNPRQAPAYRVASDILWKQAEIRDPAKYGQKVQHELKAPPLKPDDLRAEIRRLEEELGVKVASPSSTTTTANDAPVAPDPNAPIVIDTSAAAEFDSPVTLQ